MLRRAVFVLGKLTGGVFAAPRRYVVLPKDFEKGYKSNVKKSNDEFEFYK